MMNSFLSFFADKPSPPKGPLEASEINGESLTLTWQPPKDDGGEPIANYIVEKKKVGTNHWQKVTSFCNSPSCQVRLDICFCFFVGGGDGGVVVVVVVVVDFFVVAAVVVVIFCFSCCCCWWWW
jgi:hypothetical protein